MKRDEAYKLYKDCRPSYKKCLKSFRLWNFMHQIVNDNYADILIIPESYAFSNVPQYLFDCYRGQFRLQDDELRLVCEGAFQFMVYNWQECIKFKYIQV